MDDWLAPADERANEAAAGRGRPCRSGRSRRDRSPGRDARGREASGDRRRLRLGRRGELGRARRACRDARRARVAGVVRRRRPGSPEPPAVRGSPPRRPRRACGTRSTQYDVVLVVGAPAFRQYPYVAGTLAPPGTRVAVVTNDPAEAHRSVAELAVLAPRRRRSAPSSPAGCRRATIASGQVRPRRRLQPPRRTTRCRRNTSSTSSPHGSRRTPSSSRSRRPVGRRCSSGYLRASRSGS